MIVFLIVYLVGLIALVRRIDNRLKVAESSREAAFWIGIRSDLGWGRTGDLS